MEMELYAKLNSDDQLELALRHLSAYIYEHRTKDYVGGARLRAVQAPGSQVDIAPSWMIADATAHSKQEHQRDERVHQELRRRQYQSPTTADRRDRPGTSSAAP